MKKLKFIVLISMLVTVIAVVYAFGQMQSSVSMAIPDVLEPNAAEGAPAFTTIPDVMAPNVVEGTIQIHIRATNHIWDVLNSPKDEEPDIIHDHKNGRSQPWVSIGQLSFSAASQNVLTRQVEASFVNEQPRSQSPDKTEVSPDGQKRAYPEMTQDGLFITIKNEATGEVKPVYEITKPSEIQSATPESWYYDHLISNIQCIWSPDSSQFAFVDGAARIAVLDADSGEIQLLVEGHKPLENPSLVWSPDGAYLAFISRYDFAHGDYQDIYYLHFAHVETGDVFRTETDLHQMFDMAKPDEEEITHFSWLDADEAK